MEISEKLRYAHSSGHTDICYSPDGQYIMTCGADAEVRKWCNIDDDDPQAKGTSNQKAVAVVSMDERLYVSGDDNKVAIYSLTELTHEGILSRASAPVTCMSISSDGKWLASGGCDFVVHVTDIKSHKDSQITAHTAPILSVAFDPKGEFLVSSSCDGSVRIWEVGTNKLVKSWSNAIPTSNDFFASTTLARMSWEPKSGRTLAIPFGDTIKVIQRGSWNETMTLKNPAIKKPFSIVSFSPCSRLLVATSGDGLWSLFDVASGYKLIQTEPNKRNTFVTGLDWKPNDRNKLLAYCTFDGNLGNVSFSLPDDDMDEVEDIVEAAEREIEDDITSDIDLDLDGKMPRPESRLSIGTVDGSVMTGQIAAVPRMQASFVMQEPFQPSACPVHLQRRFMVYNNVGIVIYISDDSDSSTIDVEFHNISVHHNMSMPNIFDHTICALTEEVLVLSGPRQDSARSSKVVVQMLQSSDSTREWMVDLLPGEESVAVAAGLGFVAVGTNEGSVRLFCTAGTQRDVLSVGGQIVSMAAHGKQLMVVYLTGVGSKSFQSYGFVIFSIRDNSIRFSKRHQHMAVPSDCTLRWIGFTDEGNPCYYDSAGKIHIIAHNGISYLLADTERFGDKGSNSHYFLIGVNETEMKFRGIMCKGSHYPPIAPRPIMAEILIQAPVCDAESSRGKLEEEYIRTKRAAYSSTSICPSSGMPKDDDYSVISNVKSFNTTLLRLFAMACMADLDSKAYGIYKLMTASEWKVKARQYAHSKNRSRLLEKLEDFIEPVESDEETVIIEESQEIESRYKMLSRHNSAESFASRSEVQIEPIKVSKLKRMNSLQRSFEMFSSPSQSGNNPFKKNASKPPLSETQLSKNTYVDSQDEVQRSETPDSIQMDSTIVNTNDSEMAGDTHLMEKDSPVKTADVQVNENSTSASVKGFKEWFESNRSSLESEFPGMKITALKKEAVKKFKAASKPAGKKRGAASKQDEPQPKKIAYKKLDAFLFKKKAPEPEPQEVPEPEDKEENTQFDSDMIEPSTPSDVIEPSTPLSVDDTPDH